jgi:hypothetical protein
VHHVVAVGVGQCARDLARDRQRVVQRQLRFPLEALAQRFSFDVRHDVIQQVARGAGVVQGQDVGVVELGGDLDLAEEPFRAQSRGDLVAQHLNGDSAVVSWVAGQEYHRHPAAAELPLERVTVRQGDPEALLELGHMPLR